MNLFSFHRSKNKTIRTRYSLATALFLLFLLSVFYIGGRIVLVHMMRDAEKRVNQIWVDLSGLVYRNADQVRRSTRSAAQDALNKAKGRYNTDDLLTVLAGSGITLIIEATNNENFGVGTAFIEGVASSISSEEITPYIDRFNTWRTALESDTNSNVGVGIINIREQLYYVTLAKSHDQTRTFILGTPFDLISLSGQVNAAFSGAHVNVGNRIALASHNIKSNEASVAKTEVTDSLGIAPMISEAMSFYSGGFWEIDSRPFDASFAIRDIAGGAVATISVSVPQTLSDVTRAALERLGFFIALAGIVLIIPLFWFQGYMLLNPLTKITNAIQKISEAQALTDCPRLEWNGRDEFETLVASVNKMLETISARTVDLAEIEKSQRALIAAVPDALLVLNSDGKIVSIYKEQDNAEPLPGLKISEAPPREIYDDLANYKSHLSSTLNSGNAECFTLRTTDKSRYFEVRLTKIDAHYALAIVRDKTREINEDQARITNERRSYETSRHESLTQLAAGIAHDVNNIYSIILNTVEAAELPEEALNAVRDSIKHGQALTNELRTFAGETSFQLKTISARALIEDAKILIEQLLDNNIELTYDIANSLPDINADANQFWKVLFNIVKNSVEAIGSRPGKITITASPYRLTPDEASEFLSSSPIANRNGIMIRIMDDGSGMSADLIGRIFEPYVSSKASVRGLGLATVKSIIDAHRGAIKVSSVQNFGTKINIFLPSVENNESSKINISQTSNAKNNLSNEVLIIDNDDLIIKTTTILLTALGLTAHGAHNRNETLSILQSRDKKIGTILLDANLGGTNAPQLLKTIQSISPMTRIVVTSGLAEENVVKLFNGLKFDAFLAKPYTLAELKATIC